MPRPAAVATVKRIVTDGKEGARRVAIYYAGCPQKPAILRLRTT